MKPRWCIPLINNIDTLLSIVASLLSIVAVFRANKAIAKVVALEQRMTSNVSGGQHIAGSGNVQVGGNVG